MTGPKYFIARDAESNLGALVDARTTADGVEFNRFGGGFAHHISEAEFNAVFRPVDEDEFNRMQEAFTSVKTTPHDDGEAFMEGWTNGGEWNGWMTPFFTKETILAEADGGLLFADGMNGVARFVYRAETDDILEIEPFDGGGLPETVDTDRVLAIMAESSSEDEAYAAFERMGLRVHTADKTVIALADGPATIYAVGSGWCWQPPKPMEETPSAPRV